MPVDGISIPPKLVSLLWVASRIVVLTGAGVSQESGLLTYQSVQLKYRYALAIGY